MIINAYKSNTSTPGGDSDKSRSFQDGTKPRMFPNSSKRILPVVTEQIQEQEQVQEQEKKYSKTPR